MEHRQVNTFLHIFLLDPVIVTAAERDIRENRFIEKDAPLLNQRDVIPDPVDA